MIVKYSNYKILYLNGRKFNLTLKGNSCIIKLIIRSTIFHIWIRDNFVGDNVGNKTGYDWEDDDPSIPPGWKGTTISVNSFGKMVQSR